jgi:hypothetical protein
MGVPPRFSLALGTDYFTVPIEMENKAVRGNFRVYAAVYGKAQLRVAGTAFFQKGDLTVFGKRRGVHQDSGKDCWLCCDNIGGLLAIGPGIRS